MVLAIYLSSYVDLRYPRYVTVVWVTVTLLFNYGFYAYASANFGVETGTRISLEFLTGDVVEKSLAVDNIFVFVLVFAYFGIPQEMPHIACCSTASSARWCFAPSSSRSARC